MLVAMVAPRYSASLADHGFLPWQCVLPCSIAGISAIVMLLSFGCASVPSGQSLHEAATNAAPALIQTLEAVRQVSALGGPSIWSEIVPAACGLIIGAVGIWARITHGHVATLAAAVREGQSTTKQKDNT